MSVPFPGPRVLPIFHQTTLEIASDPPFATSRTMFAHPPPALSRYRLRPAPKAALRELLEATLDWANGGIADRQLQVSGISYRLTHLADGAAGAAALLCEAPPGTRIPEYLERRRIRALTGGSVGRHLMIFTDTAHSTLVWSWMTRGDLGTRVYRELSFTPGQAWGPLRPVLESIAAGSPPLPPRRVSRSPGARSSGACSGAAANAKRPGARALLAAVAGAVTAGAPGSARSAAVQLVQDLIEGAEEAGTIRDQWSALLRIRVFDRACGGGERLERALDVLVLAYEAMLERMRSAVDDLGRRHPAPRAERLGDLRRVVRRSGGWRDPAARKTYSTELALLHNLFGTDSGVTRIEECRARLVRRLAGAANADLLALNVRLPGTSEREDTGALKETAIRPRAHQADDEELDLVRRGHNAMLAMHMEAEIDVAELARGMAAAERRLDRLAGPLVPPGHLIEPVS